MTTKPEVTREQAERELIRACLQWALDCVGEGFSIPEEAFWQYSQSTDDEDWETIPERLSTAPKSPELEDK